MDLEEQEDGDEAPRRDVQQRENAFALEQQEADEAHAEEHTTDDEPFGDDVQVRQGHQRNSHPEEDKEKRPNDEGGLQCEQVVIAVQFVHAVVIEQLCRGRQPLQALHVVGPIREKDAVVVEHQPENQNEHERTQVKQLLDGINEQQHRDAQKQLHGAGDFLQDVHQDVTHNHGQHEGDHEVRSDACDD